MELTELQEKLVEYARAKGVAVLYLFGSAAHGQMGKLSDIDVAVLLPEREPSPPEGEGSKGRGRKEIADEEYFDTRLQMTLELMELLGTSEVDLVILNQAPPLLKYNVVAGGKALYSRDDRERGRFESRAIVEYLDFKPILDVQFEYLKRRLKEGRFGVRPQYRPRTLEKA